MGALLKGVLLALATVPCVFASLSNANSSNSSSNAVELENPKTLSGENKEKLQKYLEESRALYSRNQGLFKKKFAAGRIFEKSFEKEKIFQDSVISEYRPIPYSLRELFKDAVGADQELKYLAELLKSDLQKQYAMYVRNNILTENAEFSYRSHMLGLSKNTKYGTVIGQIIAKIPGCTLTVPGVLSHLDNFYEARGVIFEKYKIDPLEIFVGRNSVMVESVKTHITAHYNFIWEITLNVPRKDNPFLLEHFLKYWFFFISNLSHEDKVKYVGVVEELLMSKKQSNLYSVLTQKGVWEKYVQRKIDLGVAEAIVESVDEKSKEEKHREEEKAKPVLNRVQRRLLEKEKKAKGALAKVPEVALAPSVLKASEIVNLSSLKTATTATVSKDDCNSSSYVNSIDNEEYMHEYEDEKDVSIVHKVQPVVLAASLIPIKEETKKEKSKARKSKKKNVQLEMNQSQRRFLAKGGKINEAALPSASESSVEIVSVAPASIQPVESVTVVFTHVNSENSSNAPLEQSLPSTPLIEIKLPVQLPPKAPFEVAGDFQIQIPYLLRLILECIPESTIATLKLNQLIRQTRESMLASQDYSLSEVVKTAIQDVIGMFLSNIEGFESRLSTMFANDLKDFIGDYIVHSCWLTHHSPDNILKYVVGPKDFSKHSQEVYIKWFEQEYGSLLLKMSTIDDANKPLGFLVVLLQFVHVWHVEGSLHLSGEVIYLLIKNLFRKVNVSALNIYMSYQPQKIYRKPELQTYDVLISTEKSFMETVKKHLDGYIVKPQRMVQYCQTPRLQVYLNLQDTFLKHMRRSYDQSFDKYIKAYKVFQSRNMEKFRTDLAEIVNSHEKTKSKPEMTDYLIASFKKWQFEVIFGWDERKGFKLGYLSTYLFLAKNKQTELFDSYLQLCTSELSILKAIGDQVTPQKELMIFDEAQIFLKYPPRPRISYYNASQPLSYIQEKKQSQLLEMPGYLDYFFDLIAKKLELDVIGRNVVFARRGCLRKLFNCFIFAVYHQFQGEPDQMELLDLVIKFQHAFYSEMALFQNSFDSNSPEILKFTAVVQSWVDVFIAQLSSNTFFVLNGLDGSLNLSSYILKQKLTLLLITQNKLGGQNREHLVETLDRDICLLAEYSD